MTIELFALAVIAVSGGASGMCAAAGLYTPRALRREAQTVGECLRDAYPAEDDAAAFATLLARLDDVPSVGGVTADRTSSRGVESGAAPRSLAALVAENHAI